MTDDNSTNDKLVDMDNDLDAFETEFFQREPVEEKKDEAPEPESDENEDDPLAAEEDTDASEEEDEAEVEDEEDGDEPEPEPKPKPKSKAQQRIEKLLERERIANEKASALEVRLAALEAQTNKEEKHEADKPAFRDQLPADAPNPDATDDKGNPIYPLGEFDPRFISDITKYTIKRELDAKQEEEQQKVQAQKVAEQQRAIQENWHTKLEEFEKEEPDVRENISDLVDTFQSLDPQYAEYLASVIMANDAGPAIMNYLSQNIGEAQTIVASGPVAAAIAVGRLEARLSKPAATEEKRNTKRVSNAAPPPANRSRGSGSRFTPSADTDDLDAFSEVFFKRP